MEQIEMLWQYQQADMAADAFEREIKRNPNRIALKKNREFLVEQQNAVKRMEQEVAEMTDRVEVIKVAITRIQSQLAALQSRLENNPPADLAQAQELTRDAQKLLNNLSDYEREMKKIQKDAADHERGEKEIRVKYAKVKAEYDQQKVAYEAEYAQQVKQLETKQAAAQEKAKSVEKALLEKYAQVKKHCVPPVARLYGDQCGGCNMSLPQVTLRKFKNDVFYIECENCGRMIIQ